MPGSKEGRGEPPRGPKAGVAVQAWGPSGACGSAGRRPGPRELGLDMQG